MTTTPPSSQTGPPSPEDPSKAWFTKTPTEPPASTSESPSDTTPQSSKRPSITDAAQIIKPADFLTVHQAPCARQGFMSGIGGGVAVMGLRWTIGSPVMKAANWGVGTFVAASVMGWEFCRYQRRKEFEKMKRVVEVYDQRQAEVAREKKIKEEEDNNRRRLEEEEAKRKGGRWKFW